MKISENTKKDILIVDDTPANLRLLSDFLTQENYKVRPAPNGALALQAAQASPPDLILLDITMPGFNGYDVCRALKQNGATSQIPVIFISVLDETLDKVLAFSVGGVDYITKPFQFEEVLARVKTHLTLSELQQRLQEHNEELERKVTERTLELVKVNKTFEKYVPREFLSYLDRNSVTNVELGDQVQKVMTVTFTDIRNFTARSEQMTPQDNFNFLNRYLGRISPVIRENGGFVDKYLGDGVMALFPGAAEDAIKGAIAVHREVEAHNETLKKAGIAPIKIGTGMNTGSLILGILGEAERLQGTVISDAVNVAARIQDLTKMYDAAILVDGYTIELLEDKNAFNYRFIDRVRVKGKTQTIAVYELFDGEPDILCTLKQRTRFDFETAINLYHSGEFRELMELFQNVIGENPNDAAAKFYFERAATFHLQGPPHDWTGTLIFGG